MNFPRFVFKSPGNSRIKEGSFNQELVKTKDEFEKMIELGWNENVLGAIQDYEDGKLIPSEVDPVETPTPDAPKPKRKAATKKVNPVVESGEV